MLLNVCPQGVEGKGEGALVPVKIASEVNCSEYLSLQHECTSCTCRVHRLRILVLFHRFGVCTKPTLRNTLGQDVFGVDRWAGSGQQRHLAGTAILSRCEPLSQLYSPGKGASGSRWRKSGGKQTEWIRIFQEGNSTKMESLFLLLRPLPPGPGGRRGGGEACRRKLRGRALSGERGCRACGAGERRF